MAELNYKDAGSMESSSGIGIKLSVACSHNFTDLEKAQFRKIIDDLETLIQSEQVRLDPKTTERVQDQRANLLRCFPLPIYVEPIENGYAPNDWYWRHFPWYTIHAWSYEKAKEYIATILGN